MTINNDKSVNLESKYLMLNSMVEEDDFDIESYKKRGMSVQRISENDYSGILISKKYVNIDKISSSEDKKIVISDYLEDDFDDSVLFKVEKGFFKNTYTANFVFETESSDDDFSFNEDISSFDDTTSDSDIFTEDNFSNDDDSSDFSEDDISKMSEMEFKFKVNLPNKNISTNATEVSNDGKELSWNLISESSNNINFSFEIINTNNLYLAIGAGILILVTIIVITAIFIKKKKNKNNDFNPEEYNFNQNINQEVTSQYMEQDINLK